MAEDVKLSGPVFDGRAQAALDAGCDAVRKQLAADAQKAVLAVFLSRIKHNTGKFEHSITQTRTSRTYSTRSGKKTYTMPVVVDDMATDIAVTTDIATYGPWLEGTGSRNDTTRFKGYNGFRLAAQELNKTAGTIADATFKPYAERMQ